MSFRDYRLLIDRGRKAGLNTAELYLALQGQPAAPVGNTGSHGDSNGFETVYDACGQVIHRPHNRPEYK